MLSNKVSVGPVTLIIPDLSRSVAFYEQVLGFFTLEKWDGRAKMGTKERGVLLELEENLSAPAADRRAPGLFHFAVLLPNRVALGRSLLHLVEVGWKLSGAGDHLVSEALYLTDPDGNGIELYCDRPRETWRIENGRVSMDTLSVDVESLIKDGKTDSRPWEGIPDGTVMGHVHLKVNDVEAAGRFYTEAIGFDIMATWEQALFVAAGGYHHHLGLNAWMSNGAPMPPQGHLGLKGFRINFEHQKDLAEVVERIRSAGYVVDQSADDPFVSDPSGNGVWLHAGR